MLIPISILISICAPEPSIGEAREVETTGAGLTYYRIFLAQLQVVGVIVQLLDESFPVVGERQIGDFEPFFFPVLDGSDIAVVVFLGRDDDARLLGGVVPAEFHLADQTACMG